MIFIVFALLICAFAYRNLHYDYGKEYFMNKKGKALGFIEKIYHTKDGSEIAYLEGPDNGEPLLLIHGQMVSKEDYAEVLPELSNHFHIFAADCYGHGNSSKDPNTYNIISIRDDLIYFMKEVIGEKSFVTGHSSGALISAALAANNKDQVCGLLLEDGLFFFNRTEKGEKYLRLSRF